ncbi:hypothetical protein C8T65DRAFT_744893 [Cerioporus squamosus]|nr:hypothetical protein C8T65DRAFT_744893 [Cerioporus squamosus]
MPATETMDITTRISRIRDLTGSIQAGWLARPGLDHPKHLAWEAKCREELIKLKALVRHVQDPLPVPSLVLAFLVEHNRAFTAKERSYNYEALNPNNSYDKAGLFLRDDKYRFRHRETGWWSEFTDATDEVASKESSAGGKGKAPSRLRQDAPDKSKADAPAREDDVEAGKDDSDRGRRTRARTRAIEQGETSKAGGSSAAPAGRKAVGAPKPVPPNKPKAAILGNSTAAPPPLPSPSPAPGGDGAIWDPASQAIVDAWLLSPIKCKRCAASNLSCRVNLVHGVACNRCTNSNLGCSFASKKPDTGTNWTYDQRRWILVHWARSATTDSLHPSEVISKLKGDFVPPDWFLEGLQRARELTESPSGQKRRTQVPTSDVEDQTPTAQALPAPAKRKRATRSKTAAIQEDEDEDHKIDVDGDGSSGNMTNKLTTDDDSRPVKRARIETGASSVVPQTQRTWKQLRNVEHLLRDRSAMAEDPVGKLYITESARAATSEYAPNYDQFLLPESSIPPPLATSPPPLHSSPLFSAVSLDLSGPRLVNTINGNNAFFNAKLAAVWEALSRQQAAHDAVKEETRRELDALKTSLAGAIRDSGDVMRERDALRQETQQKTAEIDRLRRELFALQSRTVIGPPGSPGASTHDDLAGCQQVPPQDAVPQDAVPPALPSAFEGVAGRSQPENTAQDAVPHDTMESALLPFHSSPPAGAAVVLERSPVEERSGNSALPLSNRLSAGHVVQSLSIGCPVIAGSSTRVSAACPEEPLTDDRPKDAVEPTGNWPEDAFDLTDEPRKVAVGPTADQPEDAVEATAAVRDEGVAAAPTASGTSVVRRSALALGVAWSTERSSVPSSPCIPATAFSVALALSQYSSPSSSRDVSPELNGQELQEEGAVASADDESEVGVGETVFEDGEVFEG